MNEMDEPVTGREVVDLLTVAILETVAALAPTSKVADENLEDIASQLLTLSGKFTNLRLSALLGAIAQQLIQTEAGSG